MPYVYVTLVSIFLDGKCWVGVPLQCVRVLVCIGEFFRGELMVESNIHPIGASGRERYVAVDPGCVTGLVMVELGSSWRLGDLYPLLSGLHSGADRGEIGSALCRQMEISGPEEGQIDSIMKVISGGFSGVNRCRGVVIEDFILRERTKTRDLLAPVRLAARLQDRLYVAGFAGDICLQTPSEAKSIATDERLKSWGLWHRGSPHIRDAWRHMVVYLRNHR